MRVLFVTGNPYLASTTRPLDAVLEVLGGKEISPYFLFARPGPWQAELASRGYPVTVRPLSWPSKTRAVSSAWDISWLVSYLLRNKIDLIHCNEHEHYPAVRHAAYLTGTPILVTLHYNLEGGFARWAFRAPYTPQVLQFLSYGQWQLSKAELPFTSSNVVHVTASGLSVRKVRDAATGRNLRKELGIPEDTLVIGTAGAIRPRKRMEDFIRLIGHLKQRGLRVVGWVAGGGHSIEEPYKRKLDALIDQLGLHDVCRFVGFIYPCTDFYTALDIYVHTSNMEIFCMSLCEAQAIGIPSLAYDVGGNREAVPNDECIVPLGALDVLTSKVEALVRNKEFRLAAGRIAMQFVEENLDAPIYAAKVRALYSKALEGRPAHV